MKVLEFNHTGKKLTIEDQVLEIKKPDLFVNSAKEAANPCFPPAEPPNCFLVRLDDLTCRLDPSIFIFISLNRLLIWLDLFNLPVACFRFNNFPAPNEGGGGGGAPPFLNGIGGGTDPFKGKTGGGRPAGVSRMPISLVFSDLTGCLIPSTLQLHSSQYRTFRLLP